MTMHNSSQGDYVINAESGAEAARLLEQEELIRGALGGPLADLPQVDGIYEVLDIGCGPGGWVRAVAQAFPDMEVTGIDSSKNMISYAQAHASVRHIPNVHFQVMDATKKLNFADSTFDLVHGGLIAAFLRPATWRQLVQECRRITRPGGILYLMECDGVGTTTSQSLNRLIALSIQAAQKVGLSPVAWNGCITPLLARFLREAGYEQIQSRAHVIDYSTGMPGHETMVRNWMMAFKLVQPFVVQAGVAEQDEAEDLYQQALEEMEAPDFCGLFYLLSAWGIRSEDAESV